MNITLLGSIIAYTFPFVWWVASGSFNWYVLGFFWFFASPAFLSELDWYLDCRKTVKSDKERLEVSRELSKLPNWDFESKLHLMQSNKQNPTDVNLNNDQEQQKP